jgi:hypothetical protein
VAVADAGSNEDAAPHRGGAGSDGAGARCDAGRRADRRRRAAYPESPAGPVQRCSPSEPSPVRGFSKKLFEKGVLPGAPPGDQSPGYEATPPEGG